MIKSGEAKIGFSRFDDQVDFSGSGRGGVRRRLRRRGRLLSSGSAFSARRA